MAPYIPYFVTFIFVIIGLILAGIAKKAFSIDNGPLFASLIFAPIVAYLVLSGQLLEFKGFGIEAKFRDVAAQFVEIESPNIAIITPTSDSIKELSEKAKTNAFFGIGSEIVLLQTPINEEQKKFGFREVFQVAHQIYPSLLQGIFQFLIVLDESDRVLGYFGKEFFYDLLRIEMEQTIRGKRTEFQKEMVKEQLQQTQLWDIVEFPKMRAESWGIRDTIPIKTSNIDALKIMRDKNLNAIVVVDGKGKYNGIVKRNDIVTDLLLKISESSVK